jgi:hypothetical protein
VQKKIGLVPALDDFPSLFARSAASSSSTDASPSCWPVGYSSCSTAPSRLIYFSDA